MNEASIVVLGVTGVLFVPWLLASMAGFDEDRFWPTWLFGAVSFGVFATWIYFLNWLIYE